MRSRVSALAFAPTLLVASVGWASEPIPSLRFNPFKPPAHSLPTPQAKERRVADRATSWSPKLRATLLSENQSLVNIDGELLALGDEVQGYALVKIEERRAVLERHGQRTVLTLDDE